MKFKIRTVNEDGEHGMWKDIVTHDPGIHTNLLLSLGWTRNGTTYTKGEDVIKYDGTNWWLNGKEIIQLIQTDCGILFGTNDKS